jgi:hypothetical protein
MSLNRLWAGDTHATAGTVRRILSLRSRPGRGCRGPQPGGDVAAVANCIIALFLEVGRKVALIHAPTVADLPAVEDAADHQVADLRLRNTARFAASAVEISTIYSSPTGTRQRACAARPNLAA